MGDIQAAVGLASIFGILIGFIELSYRTKAGFGSCVTSSTAVYIVILLIGNTATTLIAAGLAPKSFVMPASSIAETAQAKSPPSEVFESGRFSADSRENHNLAWFWYAFLSVFGFEVLLQNISLTFAGKGVLSINDWITKARDSAEAAAIKAETESTHNQALNLAQKLKNLPEDQLNAYVLNMLDKSVTELDEAARQANADARLYKALALAYGAPNKVAAIK
jgi:hypothetical protein